MSVPSVLATIMLYNDQISGDPIIAVEVLGIPNSIDPNACVAIVRPGVVPVENVPTTTITIPTPSP